MSENLLQYGEIAVADATFESRNMILLEKGEAGL